MQSMKDKRTRVGKHSRIGMQPMVGKQAIFFQEQIWDIGGGMGFLIPAHTPSCYDSDESDSPPPSMPAPLPQLSTEGVS